MLNIFFGDMPEAIYNTAVYFKNVYEDEWITDSFSRKMILDVDKSIVLEQAVIDSPVMGKIPPTSLSGGVKTLILLIVNLRHIMDFGEGKFEIRILNTNQVVHDMGELVPIAGLYV